MKLLTIAAACAALSSLTLASAAFAGDSVTAKLAAPVAAKTKIIAGGSVFTCEGDACVAGVVGSQTFAGATCKTIADKVGPVAAFTGVKAFDDTRLAACNAAAVAKAAGATELAKK